MRPRAIFSDQGIAFSSGKTVPADGADHFAPGCLFVHTDGSTGQLIYINRGTITSANFDEVATPDDANTWAGAQTFSSTIHVDGVATFDGAATFNGVTTFTGNMVQTGIASTQIQGVFNSTTQGYGVKLLRASTTAAHRHYADDGGAVLWATGSVPDLRTGVDRLLVTIDQSGGFTRLFGHQGILACYDGLWNNEVAAGEHGVLQIVNSATKTLGGYGVSAGVIGQVSTGASSVVVVNTNHVLAGVAAIADLKGTVTQTGKVAGVLVDAYNTSQWSDATARVDWGYGVLVKSATVAGLAITDTPTDGILISGACTDAIHISGTNTATGLHISGDQVICIDVDVDESATSGIHMTTASGKTTGTGLLLDGTGTFTAGITISATVCTTGITLSAGSMADAILISGTTPVDGIEISSACSANAINISGHSAAAIRIDPGNVLGIIQGAEAFSAAGSGIVIDGVTRHSGCEFYFDDGGVKLAAGYTEAFRTGYLVSTAITTADVSLYTAHDYVYLAANVSTAGGVGGTWGSMLVKTGVTITTTSGVCDFSGAHFTCEVPSGATIGTGTWACGASVGGNLGGTHTGSAAGYRVRVPSAGKWDAGLRIEPLSCVECLQVGTAAFSAAGSGIPLNGVTQHSGAEIYFDDGGVKLAAGYTEAWLTGFLVSTAITTADVSLYTVHDYVYLAADVSTAGGVGASWASMLVKAGVTITTTSGVCDFSAFNASCDVPSTAVIGTGTFVAGIAMGGNLGGTHTGKAVAFRVRTPSAGAWDGLCDLPSALSGPTIGAGALVYIPIYINGVAAKLVANYVA